MARKRPRLDEQQRKELEEDFALLEEKLKVLRAEFNQFFIGARRDPPDYTEAMVRRVLRKYAGDGVLAGPDRFRYFNLVARYTTLREYWGRRVRLREQGSAAGGSASASVSRADELVQERRRQMASRLEQHFYTRTVSDPRRERESVRKLYVGYMRATRSVGGTSFLKLTEFERLIEQQTSSLCERKGCGSVQFRVTVEEGQVKLKAKPGQGERAG